jgi:acetoin:2,6-dichlorophenolindophenol oxidoreductase subunit alpha
MKLLETYKKLYLIRKSEELITKHYKEDEMKTPMHMSMGEEAIVVGVVAALQKIDQVFGTYRSHGLYLAKSDDTDKFFAELYGKVTGSARGRSGSMHLASPEKGMMLTAAIVGATIPVAVGAALANKSLKNRKVVVSFFGDGAINEGVFWESLNFACLKKLPILFVCEDNDLAIHSPTRERVGYKSIVQVVSQFHCNVDSSDTTDVFEIGRKTKEMIERMRQNGNPGFLHLKYYRYLEHVGVNEDFHFGYRSKQEFLKWKRVDPLLVARKHLLEAEVKESDIIASENIVDRILIQSLNKARKAAYPSEGELFFDIYG